MFEDDLLIAQGDRLEPRIHQHLNFGWHRISQAKRVRCCHAIDHPADLITARDRIDDSEVVWDSRFTCERILGRLVVKPSLNTSQLARRDHALQSLVDSAATTDVGKVGRRPHLVRRFIYARTKAIW